MTSLIRIQKIQFHISGQTPTHPLRRNASTDSLIEPPEWLASRVAAGQPQGAVAFIRSKIDDGGKPLARVTFERDTDSLEALSFDVSAKPVADGSSLLGRIPLHRLEFRDGDQTVETDFGLTLSGADGVVATDCEWDWTFRSAPNQPLGSMRTRHRAYVLLAEPKDPWGTEPKVQPWTDILDLVCSARWAGGARSFKKAQRRIAFEFFRKGIEGELVYEGSMAFFLVAPRGRNRLNCTDLLQQLNDGQATSVDCRDSAAALSSFANILGCQMSILGIKPQIGKIFALRREVRAIGNSPALPKSFDFHEVAVFESSRPGGEALVWDGSIQLDVAQGPSVARRTPASMFLSNYFKALSPTPLTTVPIPTTRAVVETPETEPAQPMESIASSDSPFMRGRLFDGFTLDGFAPAERASSHYFDQTTRWVRPGDRDSRLFSQAAVHSSFEKAKDFFKAAHDAVAGEVAPLNASFQEAFSADGGMTVVFRRGNLVCRISRSSRDTATDVVEVARQLDRRLLAQDQPDQTTGSLELPNPGPDNRVFYRWLAPSGKFVMKAGRLFFDGDLSSLLFFRHPRDTH